MALWKFEGVFQGHFVFDMIDVREKWTYDELQEYKMACYLKQIIQESLINAGS